MTHDVLFSLRLCKHWPLNLKYIFLNLFYQVILEVNSYGDNSVWVFFFFFPFLLREKNRRPNISMFSCVTFYVTDAANCWDIIIIK